MITLTEADARRIVRLLGDVALMQETRTERRKALLSGLAELVGADSWAWATAAHTIPGEKPAHAGILTGGFSKEQIANLFQATEHPDMAAISAPFFDDINRSNGHVTRLIQQIDPDNHFERCDAYPLWREAGVGPLLLSARPTADGQISFVGFYRKPGRDFFDERESKIAHIVLTEVPSLHEEVSPASLNGEVTGLSPRLRSTLNLLLQGFQRKEIADSLSLSIHTVGEYIAEIYRRFDVHSHAGLLRRFLVGDCGDEPGNHRFD